MKTSATRACALTAALPFVVITLSGCGGGGTTSSPATAAAATTAASAGAAVDPCSLLTDAEVGKLVSGVAHGKLQTVAGTRICEWPDSHGIPTVQLQVTTAPTTSLREELANLNAGNDGYSIVSVAGIGDEAAAAFQKADPSKGIQAGMATLAARSGESVVSLSTPLVQVLQGSRRFTVAKQLASKAISRLPSG